MKKLLLSVAIAGLSVPVFAQSYNVEETVVTATRVEQPLHKALAAVSIVTRADIDASPAVSLPELLGRLPGIDMSASGGRGSTSSIFTRGTNSEHTLILIDGVRSSSATSGTADLQRIPLDQIERIEVVRGPRSSLYGAEAIGGVIQIFTRQPEGGSVTAEVGSHDLRKTSFSYGGGETTKYRITAAHEKSSGFSNLDLKDTVDNDSDGYEEQSLNVAVNHRLDNGWQLGATATIVDATNEFDSRADDYTDSINQSLSATADGSITEELNASIEIAQYKDERDTFGSNVSFFNTERNSVLGQLNYQFAKDNTLSAGYDYYEDKVDSSTDFSEDSRDNKAYFVQYQGQLEAVSITASFRSDDDESFGRNNTRSFSAGYNLADDTLIAVSYGTAFKAPTFNDLYYPFQDFRAWGWGTYQGNLDLQPESSETYEFMARGRWNDVDWSFSYYETNVDDLIEYTVDADFNGTMNNISDAKITGAELSAGFMLADYQIDASVSYTDPRDDDSDKLIDNRARETANVSISKDYGDINVGLHWKAQSHRFTNASRLAGYNTVDLTVNYDVNQDLSLTLYANNIFDTDYALNDISKGVEYNTPRANFSLAARYQFGR